MHLKTVLINWFSHNVKDKRTLFGNIGAIPVHERVVIDRNRITGGGVTTGTDFGLVVAAELCGVEVAQRIQLILEYNPAPPFTSGSPATAPARLTEQAVALSQANRQRRHEIAERAAARIGRADAPFD